MALLIFFVLFFKKKYDKIYQVKNISLDFSLLKKCLRIGTPNAMNCFISWFGWAAILQILAIHVSADEFTVLGISHAFFVLFFFLIDGTGKGVSVICSNAIGRRHLDIVGKNLRSAVLLLSIFSAVALVGMILYPDFLIRILLPSDLGRDIFSMTTIMLIWIWLSFCTEGIEYNLLSMLTAAGDTKFPMIVSACSFCFVTLLPVYFLVTKFNFGVILLLQLNLLDMLVRIGFFWARYLSGKWRLIKITGEK